MSRSGPVRPQALAAALVAILATGCHAVRGRDPLVGRYGTETRDGTLVVELRDDGMFKEWSIEDGYARSASLGTWRAWNGQVAVKFWDKSRGAADVGPVEGTLRWPLYPQQSIDARVWRLVTDLPVPPPVVGLRSLRRLGPTTGLAPVDGEAFPAGER